MVAISQWLAQITLCVAASTRCSRFAVRSVYLLPCRGGLGRSRCPHESWRATVHTQGGTRVSSFLSGGALPAAVRGATSDTLLHGATSHLSFNFMIRTEAATEIPLYRELTLLSSLLSCRRGCTPCTPMSAVHRECCPAEVDWLPTLLSLAGAKPSVPVGRAFPSCDAVD
eukprot:COSAG01_NODE_5548_length_4191_cov_36.852151_3_plen_170_part_00